MYDVTQADMDAILNPRVRLRKRMLKLPVERGSLGELKPCPLPAKGSQLLRCGARRVRVTVREVARVGDEWWVRFEPDPEGKLQDFLTGDDPLFLRAGGGYTPVRDEIKAGEVALPLAKDLARARREAREGRIVPARKAVADVQATHKTCRAVMFTMKQETRVRRMEKEARALDAELSAEASATLAESQRPARSPSPAKTDSTAGQVAA